MEIVIIAAVSEDGYIGGDGKIPWKLPKDLTRFKKLTIGHPVIMGRKTYESLPESVRPLPNRLSYVLSRNDEYDPLNGEVVVAQSLDHAIGLVQQKHPHLEGINYDVVYIIGGEEVYKEGIEIADKLEMTHVHRKTGGDKRFPEIDLRIWKDVETHDLDGFSFTTYERVGK
ncbi:MAG: dihydrofolate reductase [Candidatus Altiarchaeota archaeon]|nr:dihydrofolate reductase [Candidatus Altiarchaeota archaeon]